jgi:hypothetical protein
VYFCPGYGCLFEKWETYDIYSIFRLGGPKKHQDWVGANEISALIDELSARCCAGL